MLTRYAIIGKIDGGDGDGGMYVDVDMLELVERAELVGLNSPVSNPSRMLNYSSHPLPCSMVYRGSILRVLEVSGMFVLTAQTTDNLPIHRQNP